MIWLGLLIALLAFFAGWTACAVFGDAYGCGRQPESGADAAQNATSALPYRVTGATFSGGFELVQPTPESRHLRAVEDEPA